MKDELLRIEEKLWTGDADDYREHLDERCLIAFSEMAGVSSREEVAGMVDGEPPRWRDIDIRVDGMLEPTEGVAILTYRASAVRDDTTPYEAQVSSGYVERDGHWKPMSHQQAPLPG